jgi:hypothetical protein
MPKSAICDFIKKAFNIKQLNTKTLIKWTKARFSVGAYETTIIMATERFQSDSYTRCATNNSLLFQIH